MSVARELFDMPPQIARLPRDRRGYPVPEFVHWENGEPDFRILKNGWREKCHKETRCWLCGGHMGSRLWFVIGPMCSITRTTLEPPSHRLCAEFAVKNCPFLTRPLAKRNEHGLEDIKTYSVGNMIERNPGVTIIWEARNYTPFRVGSDWLITVGDPQSVSAWREGRLATRDELMDSILSGVPILHTEALKEGPEAEREFLKILSLWRKKVLDRWFPEQEVVS